ncbi:hypothetical protein BGX38DRAFT_730468 [Terfezia claveryi]|nr:hypothetical protein BGX38DRAFT_730468 [Terfezia claveryi]
MPISHKNAGSLVSLPGLDPPVGLCLQQKDRQSRGPPQCNRASCSSMHSHSKPGLNIITRRWSCMQPAAETIALLAEGGGEKGKERCQNSCCDMVRGGMRHSADCQLQQGGTAVRGILFYYWLKQVITVRRRIPVPPNKSSPTCKPFVSQFS